jgi:hypothetical protein
MKIIRGGIIGPVIEATAVGVGVFETPLLISSTIDSYSQWGAELGEQTYYAFHPDELGQMSYTAADLNH